MILSATISCAARLGWIHISRQTDAVTLDKLTLEQRVLTAYRCRWPVTYRRCVQSRALLERQIQSLLQTRVAFLNLL